MKLFEMKQLHTAALDRAENFIRAGKSAGRDSMTPIETAGFESAMAEAKVLEARMAESEKVNSLSSLVKKHGAHSLAVGFPAGASAGMPKSDLPTGCGKLALSRPALLGSGAGH